MALVSKILESTLTAGSTTVTFTDSDIPNSLIRVFSSNSDIIPESRTLSGNTLTVTYAPQSNNIDVAAEIVKQGLDIVDNVLSEDTDKALSAKQGYLLSAAIGDVSDGLSTLTETVNNLDIPDNITDLDDVTVSDIQSGQVLAWDGTKFVNVNQSGGSGYPFIDMSNKIYGSGNITSNYSSFSYTATQDSFLVCTIRSGSLNATAGVFLNGEFIAGNSSTQTIICTPVLIKTGDVITVRNIASSIYAIDIYGIRR